MARVRKAGWKARAYLEWLFLTRDWAWRWGMAASKAAEALLATEAFDLLIADGPPHASLVPVVRLGRRKDIPTLVDLRDVWWDAGEGSGPFSRMSPRLRRKEWGFRLREYAVRQSAHVVLTSHAMSEVTRSWFPDLDPSHFSAVTNSFGDVDDPAGPPDPSPNGRIRLTYTGSLAYGRVDQAIQLVRGLRDLRERGLDPVEVLLVGDEDTRIEAHAEEEGVADLVTVQGWVEADRAVELQREADALLLLQPPGRLETQVAIPGKLFDYMERRRNVFGLLGAGPAAEIIQKHGLGVVTSSEDPRGMGKALLELVERVRARPVLPLPPTKYSERATVEEFAGLVGRVLTGLPG
jgi:glycosyltransferase involved in cell wall biosynthesis